MSDLIVFEVRDGVGVLRVNRPKTRNALNWEAQSRFAEIIEQCFGLPELRALIVTGTGDIFVAGGDIRDQVDQFDAETGAQLKQIMSGALQRLTELPVPVIAAINGDAYGGGCEIVTACDVRLISAESKLYFVQTKMGLTTGWGGTARLVHLIGASRAMEILLTAQPVDAQRAVAIGLAHEIVEGDVVAAAQRYAEQIKRLPGNALGALKRLVWESDGLERGYSAETRLFVAQWQHPNHIEAVNAFLEKRRPKFH